MNKIVFSALLFLTAGSLAAQTDTSTTQGQSWTDGLYIGAGAGFLRIETDLSSNGLLPPNGEPIDSNDFNKTSITGKLFAGYRFMPYAGIELGYFKAYDVEQSYCFTVSATDNECSEDPRGGSPSIVSSSAWTVTLKPSGYTASVAGFRPINDSFELMARVGGVYSKINANAGEQISNFIPEKDPVIPPFNPQVNTTIKNSGWDATGAIGLNFNSESGVSVRAEIEYFDISEISEPWMASLNAIYNF